MGFFSFKTSDTKKSISNVYARGGALPVWLLEPNGNKVFEKHYQGYGVFGGKDVNALLAQWNVPERCNGDVEHDRLIGIDLKYQEPEKIKYPIKLVEDGNLNYDEVEASADCKYQGYFYE